MVTNKTIIISMTSWPPRIEAVANAFLAIINQKKDWMDVHFVLVLCSLEFPNKERDLPKELLDLDIEILWTIRNTRSHKKLMPTLRKYPENAIIVVDDDVCQVNGWLETFINDHEKHPNDIIFGQSTSVCHIGLDDCIYEFRNGCCYEIPGSVVGMQKPASGAAGTLFPPHVFTKEEFYNEDLMMELSPSCDETWQFAFALMEGRTIRALSSHNLPIVNPCNQEQSLIKENIHAINGIHAAIANRFPRYKEELRKRQERLVVGIYSHDERLSKVHHTINSLLNQSFMPSKIFLNIPEGQQNLLDPSLSNYIGNGILEVFEVPQNFNGHNKYLYTILKNPNATVLIVSDDCIYTYNTVRKFWLNYLNNPLNVYAGKTKIIAINPDGSPMEYKYWGTHGRNYKEFEGYKDQIALPSGGILIPPSSVAHFFNKNIIEKFNDASDVVLHSAIVSSTLNIAKLNIDVFKNSDFKEECDNEEQVNEFIKGYRVY